MNCRRKTRFSFVADSLKNPGKLRSSDCPSRISSIAAKLRFSKRTPQTCPHAVIRGVFMPIAASFCAASTSAKAQLTRFFADNQFFNWVVIGGLSYLLRKTVAAGDSIRPGG